MARSDNDDNAGLQREPLESVFATLESPLLAYALKLVRDRGTAEDLVQEAFVRLHGRWDTVSEPKSWLYRTIHNLALNHQRKHRKIVPLEPDDGESAPDRAIESGLSPDEALAQLEAVEETRRCLDAMNEDCRRLIRMKFEEQKSYLEISEATGWSVGNVGYKLHHALKDLGAALRKAGVHHE